MVLKHMKTSDKVHVWYLSRRTMMRKCGICNTITHYILVRYESYTGIKNFQYT